MLSVVEEKREPEGVLGDGALDSRSVIVIRRDCVARTAWGQLDGLHRVIGCVWRRWRIPKWRATVDEDGHYSFAVPL